MYYSLDPITHELIHHDDVRKWAEDFEGNRRIKSDKLAHGTMVSTVFLGLDHNFGGDDGDPDYRPVVFETMVFGPPLWIGAWNQYQTRYSSYEEAVAGHAAVMKSLENYLSKGFRFRNIPLALKEWYQKMRTDYFYWKLKRNFGKWPKRYRRDNE